LRGFVEDAASTALSVPANTSQKVPNITAMERLTIDSIAIPFSYLDDPPKTLRQHGGDAARRMSEMPPCTAMTGFR
jgi:hypothetical protein